MSVSFQWNFIFLDMLQLFLSSLQLLRVSFCGCASQACLVGLTLSLCGSGCYPQCLSGYCGWHIHYASFL